MIMAEKSSSELRLERVLADYLHAVEAGTPPDREELIKQHPDLADDLRSFFRNRDAVDRMAGSIKKQWPQMADTIGASEPSDAGVGATIRYFGDYELLEEIARGGMGVVYKARQVSLNRIVAVKMILAGQLASEAEVRRFRAEAEAAANLKHSNIVAIHEVGQHDGQHYFSMDYIPGRNLADTVRQGPLAPKQAARYVRIIAEAVQFAHQHGTLHRDLKPSNILIDSTDQPHVTDFGLAKRVEDEAQSAERKAPGTPRPALHALTQTGQVLGTPSYMPPEQAGGKRGQVGPASDVYALGAILYHLVTARPPFQAATPLDTLLQVLDTEPVSPRLLNPAIDLDMETICLKCLQKEPERRYASAQALADDLERFLNGQPIHARPIGDLRRFWRWCRRNPRVALLSGTVMLLLVILPLAVALVYRSESRKTAAALDESRYHLYLAHITGAQHALGVGQDVRAWDLLLPCASGQSDLRGWEWHYLSNRCRVRLVLSTRWSGTDLVSRMAWSPDGKQLAMAGAGPRENPSSSGTKYYGPQEVVSIWDVTGDLATGRLVSDQATVFNFPANAVAWSRDGRLLSATTREKGGATTWDVAKRTVVENPPDVSFAPADDTPKALWKLLAKVPGWLQAQEPISASASWSPDKRLLAVGRPTGETAIWDLGPERAVAKFDLARDFFGTSVAWSPDNQRLAVAGARVVVLNLQSGRSSTLAEPDGPFTQAAWSGDGRYLAAVAEKGVVKVWETQTWREVATLPGFPPQVPGDHPLHDKIQLAWTADSRFVAAALNRQMLLIWEADSWREALRVQHPLFLAHLDGWTRNGHRLLFQDPGRDASFRTWDPSSGAKVLTHIPHPTEKWSIPDGVQLADVRQHEIRIQDAISSPPREIMLRGHGDRIRALAWSPDRSRLASASADGTLKVWDIRRGQELLSFAGIFLSVAWSPDGRRLAACDGSAVLIWDGSPSISDCDVHAGTAIPGFCRHRAGGPRPDKEHWRVFRHDLGRFVVEWLVSWKSRQESSEHLIAVKQFNGLRCRLVDKEPLQIFTRKSEVPFGTEDFELIYV
jgi:serine/threonine protein kinase/WD40 repeat protein